MTRALLSALLAACLLLAGCGYSASTSGRAARLPQGIRTIAIPAFVNQTQTYRIEQAFTSAVAREFVARSRYQVVYEVTGAADATLRGTIVSTQLAPLTYDSRTGRASSALITVQARISLLDRSGKTLFDNPNYVFREQYQVSREVSSFFEEESPAIERLSRDFARAVVADIVESF